jgi:hypothetical protein
MRLRGAADTAQRRRESHHRHREGDQHKLFTTRDSPDRSVDAEQRVDSVTLEAAELPAW